MSIFLANDHAATTLKNAVQRHLTLRGDNIINLGTNDVESVDYPDYAQALCQRLSGKPDAIGILLCGSGMGMSMAANRYKHIRAALCHTPQVAALAREHNNANVLCLGERVVDEKTNLAIIDAFLNTAFAGGRHAQRVEKL